MTAYLVKLFVMLPLVIGLIVASLWAWKRIQSGGASVPALSSLKGLGAFSGLALPKRKRSLTIVDALPFGTAGRVAVVEFGGKHLLLGIGRSGITLLSHAPAPKRTEVADA